MMELLTGRFELLSIIAFLCQRMHIAQASTITASVTTSTSSALLVVIPTPIETCNLRTVNYITYNSPEVCLRYLKSDSIRLDPPFATVTESAEVKKPNSPGTIYSLTDASTSAGESAIPNLDADSAFDESTFLSFEDWKRQILEKEGLDSSSGDRRPQSFKDGERRRNSGSMQDAPKALTEDVMTDTDFTPFFGDGSVDSALRGLHGEDEISRNTVQDIHDERGADENRRFRSKDAGKTCKERFNFASLDAGGQIMKTNPEAKSASAVLKEDRDVYMLNTCQAKNKFLIVELSESILVETVAVANFEFFSSTFKQFRVSVIDRYPVKLDRWVDLGTFEARNLRDIQAFLIEDPRIWARYFRIEFLSHYGNEFYCPISLLRVHGRTMIQDVLSMDELTRGEGEIEDNLENMSEEDGEILVPEAIADVLEKEHTVVEDLQETEAGLEELVKIVEAITPPQKNDTLNSTQITEVKRWLENTSMEQTTTPWAKGERALATLFSLSRRTDICHPSDSPKSIIMSSQLHPHETTFSPGSYLPHRSDTASTDFSAPSAAHQASGAGMKQAIEAETHTKASSPSSSYTFQVAAPSSIGLVSSQALSAPSVVTNGAATSSSKFSNKMSAALSSHSSQPTTQESFFKTVTKRLQLLEANSTLSLKYIEEQSRILREAFAKVDKRQLVKTASFLENLNATVLRELREFGEQYDQVWQSTVVELETQRDQSRREIAAVSTRLSMLADELLFQKRMSIVQSVLLLLCLALVIFSRGPAGGYPNAPIIQSMTARLRNTLENPGDSTVSGPEAHIIEESPSERQWVGLRHRRQGSNNSARSLRSTSREYSPPTPFSTYSRQEEDPKQGTEHNNIVKGTRNSLIGAPFLKKDVSHSIRGPNNVDWQVSVPIPDEGNYPDFRNGALCLSSDLDISFSSNAQETLSAVGSQSLIDDTQKSRNIRMMSRNVNEERILATELAQLPSAALEEDRSEFNIARKPLPALPKDNR